jgi:hypothetical protein
MAGSPDDRSHRGWCRRALTAVLVVAGAGCGSGDGAVDQERLTRVMPALRKEVPEVTFTEDDFVELADDICADTSELQPMWLAAEAAGAAFESYNRLITIASYVRCPDAIEEIDLLMCLEMWGGTTFQGVAAEDIYCAPETLAEDKFFDYLDSL